MSHYDKIATSAPINRLAASTRDMSGETWEPETKSSNVRLIAPPEMKPVPPDSPNLTGKQFGRLKVIGMAAAYKNPARWVVRCSCGSYEFRRTSALLTTDVEKQRRFLCSHCDHLVEMVDLFVVD